MEENLRKKRKKGRKKTKKGKKREKGMNKYMKRRRNILISLNQLLPSLGKKFIYFPIFLNNDTFPSCLREKKKTMISPKNIKKFPPLSQGKRNQIF